MYTSVKIVRVWIGRSIVLRYNQFHNRVVEVVKNAQRYHVWKIIDDQRLRRKMFFMLYLNFNIIENAVVDISDRIIELDLGR